MGFQMNISPDQKKVKTNSIRCRQCGGCHLTIQCPLRTPDQRVKPWSKQVEEFDKKQAAKPYKCTIQLHQGKNTLVCCDTVEELWVNVQVAHNHSLYRDFAGIKKTGEATLYPPGQVLLEPGEYVLVSRTHRLDDGALCSVIANAVNALKTCRPLEPKKINVVEEQLMLNFNHFSLQHEGNELGLDEIMLLTKLLHKEDWESILQEKLRDVPGSDNDIQEAINHIHASNEIGKLARANAIDINEAFVLQLHAWVTEGLLTDADVGAAGEYRKVAIGVSGSEQGRPPAVEVPVLMKHFFETTMIQKDGEDILEYLSRIHSRFQYIHPFFDGNGRIGRLIMHSPVLVLPPTLSSMFNHGVEMGHRGSRSIFTRLLAESVFSSLQMYEDALEVTLLPSSVDLEGGVIVKDDPVLGSPKHH